MSDTPARRTGNPAEVSMSEQGTTDEQAWLTTDSAPEGVAIMTCLGMENGRARGAQALILKRGLWFVPDLSMYMYFTPTLWRPL